MKKIASPFIALCALLLVGWWWQETEARPVAPTFGVDRDSGRCESRMLALSGSATGKASLVGSASTGYGEPPSPRVTAPEDPIQLMVPSTARDLSDDQLAPVAGSVRATEVFEQIALEHRDTDLLARIERERERIHRAAAALPRETR